MKVLIAIPCLDTVDVGFAQSLVHLHGVGDVSVSFVPGSLIYVAREMLADSAIKMKADYMLWLDSDHTFNADLLTDLMADDLDFVSGLYFRRRPPFTPVLYKTIRLGLTPDETETIEYEDYPRDSVFEIDGCGFGSVLMKTEIFVKMKERFGYTFSPIPGYGEDISACIRAKQLGYKLWCDSRVKLGHIARTVSDEETYLTLKAREAQKSGTIVS